MIVYGGIFEVTKELNDMHVFDLKNEQWVVLFEELNSPNQKAAGSNSGASPNSVGLKKSMTIAQKGFDPSPRKTDKNQASLRKSSTM